MAYRKHGVGNSGASPSPFFLGGATGGPAGGGGMGSGISNPGEPYRGSPAPLSRGHAHPATPSRHGDGQDHGLMRSGGVGFGARRGGSVSGFRGEPALSTPGTYDRHGSPSTRDRYASPAPSLRFSSEDMQATPRPPTMTCEDELEALNASGFGAFTPSGSASRRHSHDFDFDRDGEVKSEFDPDSHRKPSRMGDMMYTPSRVASGYDSFGLDDPTRGYSSMLAAPDGGPGSSSMANCWVTVFGFPVGTEDVVERYFQQFGSIVNHRLSAANWLHLQYERLEDARLVLEKNGITSVIEGHMLGVKRCDDPTVLASTLRDTPFGGTNSQIRALTYDGGDDDAEGPRWRGRGRSRSRSRSRSRTPGHHRLSRHNGDVGDSFDPTMIYKKRPRPANICTRIYQFFFGV